MSFLAVGLGGFLGAVCRYQAGIWFLPFASASGFPWATLSINLSGCLILALFLPLTLDLLKLNPHLRVGVSSGFLGSFTTFSTFSAESLMLIQRGQFWLAGLYISASVFLGIFMSALGVLLARRVEAKYSRDRNNSKE